MALVNAISRILFPNSEKRRMERLRNHIDWTRNTAEFFPR